MGNPDPSVAFKNANASFFGSKPFRLVLPYLGGLHAMIGAWIDRHRAWLLGPAEDPGTFFLKSVKQTSTNAAYDRSTFFEAWRLTIQHYEIFDPDMERGAIVGLLPHGRTMRATCWRRLNRRATRSRTRRRWWPSNTYTFCRKTRRRSPRGS